MTELKIEDDYNAFHAIGLWVIAAGFISAGVYLTQIQFLGLEWLTRSGCLITLLGIWSSIGAIMQERIVMGRLNVQHRIALSKVKLKLRKVNAPKEYIDKEVASIEDQFDTEVSDAREQFRLQLGLVEVSLLMAGTFIWGFGDMLFKFI